MGERRRDGRGRKNYGTKTKISFINEIANLCDASNCDVHVVAKALGMDRRIGAKFLHPGPGYGGSCFPKDTRALLRQGEERGVRLGIVEAVVRVNEEQAAIVVAKVKRHLGFIMDRRVAVLGLAYKTNTDDVRESPAIRVCKRLVEEGAWLNVYDPMANANTARVLAGERVRYCNDSYEAAHRAECVLVLKEWNEFRNLDLSRMSSALEGNLLVDARNVYDPKKAIGFGFVYKGMGRSEEGR